MVKLSKECAGGEKAIREFAGNGEGFLCAAWRSLSSSTMPKRTSTLDLLPVVVMEGSTPIKTGSGEKQSTNYVPKFKIVGWVPRGDLLFVPRSTKVPNPPAQTPPATPPDTGSTKVGAPSEKAPALEDEFG